MQEAIESQIDETHKSRRQAAEKAKLNDINRQNLTNQSKISENRSLPPLRQSKQLKADEIL